MLRTPGRRTPGTGYTTSMLGNRLLTMRGIQLSKHHDASTRHAPDRGPDRTRRREECSNRATRRRVIQNQSKQFGRIRPVRRCRPFPRVGGHTVSASLENSPRLTRCEQVGSDSHSSPRLRSAQQPLQHAIRFAGAPWLRVLTKRVERPSFSVWEGRGALVEVHRRVPPIIILGMCRAVPRVRPRPRPTVSCGRRPAA